MFPETTPEGVVGVCVGGALGALALGCSSEARSTTEEPVAQITGAVSWIERQMLGPAEAPSTEGFGSCLSASGDTAVIGSWFSSVYVFVRSDAGWVQQQLFSSFSKRDVGVSGNTMVIAYEGGAWAYVRSGNV